MLERTGLSVSTANSLLADVFRPVRRSPAKPLVRPRTRPTSSIGTLVLSGLTSVICHFRVSNGDESSLTSSPALRRGDSYGASRGFCEVSSAGSWAECLTALLVYPQALLPACPAVVRWRSLHDTKLNKQRQSLTPPSNGGACAHQSGQGCWLASQRQFNSSWRRQRST
jgi:hypothetical protein